MSAVNIAHSGVTGRELALTRAWSGDIALLAIEH